MEDANFEDLLIKDSSWTIHENNIRTLLIEICKSLNHISPPIVQEFFNLKVTPYSLREKYFTIWYASTMFQRKYNMEYSPKSI